MSLFECFSYPDAGVYLQTVLGNPYGPQNAFVTYSATHAAAIQNMNFSYFRPHPPSAAELAGQFVCRKYRAQAAESGVYQAARNMRKQGYPIEVARAVLMEGR